MDIENNNNETMDIENNNNETMDIENNNNETMDIENNNNETKERKPSSSYKPYIDGLRAFAIVAVLLYHAYPDTFPSGFVGVDVFFVISGYLITGNLDRSLQNKNATLCGILGKFYNKRIRRLFPSLILVLILTVTFTSFILYDFEIRATLVTALASTLNGANIEILISNNDYFTSTIVSPLHHMWSLGVEEQFYIIWPLLLYFTRKMTPRTRHHIMCGYALVSFVCNISMMYTIHPMYAFYIPFSRFFEMIFGCILVYVEANIKADKDFVATIGVLMIISSVAFIKSGNLFPGWWALLPSLGTTFLLYGGEDFVVNKSVLSNSILTYVGKVSYSLYLWHYPLLVFGKLLMPSQVYDGTVLSLLSQALPAILVGITFILSHFSTKFENKIRFSKNKHTWKILSILMVCFGIACGARYNMLSETNGNLTKQSKNVAYNITNYSMLEFTNVNVRTTTQDKIMAAIMEKDLPRIERFNLGKFKSRVFEDGFEGTIYNEGKDETLVVLGDSHSFAILSRFYKTANNTTIIHRGKSGLRALPCNSEFQNQNGYDIFVQNIQYLKQSLPTSVLIINHYTPALNDRASSSMSEVSVPPPCKNNGKFTQSSQDYDKIMDDFQQALVELTELGIRVFINYPRIFGTGFDPANMIDRFTGKVKQDSIKPLQLEDWDKKVPKLNDRIKLIGEETDVKIIDLHSNMCWDDKCEVLDQYGQPVFYDGSHFRSFVVEHYLSSLDEVVYNVN